MQLENYEKQGRMRTYCGLNYLPRSNVPRYLPRRNAQKRQLRTNPLNLHWNQCPKGLARNPWPQVYPEPKPPNVPGTHTLQINQDSWPRTNTLKFFMDPMPLLFLENWWPWSERYCWDISKLSGNLENEAYANQVFFLDHCVILWEIPQRQNQYFKRDQNAVNHHTQTSFFTALKFLAKMHTTWKPLDYLAHLLNISLQWFVETFYPFQFFFLSSKSVLQKTLPVSQQFLTSSFNQLL